MNNKWSLERCIEVTRNFENNKDNPFAIGFCYELSNLLLELQEFRKLQLLKEKLTQ